MLNVGDPFPEFRAKDQTGKEWTRADLLGFRTVVYFYPKDDTSGCTVEAKGFQDSLDALGLTRVVGVSPDSEASHRKFAAKYGLSFPLWVDEDHALAEACGVWGEKSMYGKKYMGVMRTTFVVDEAGNVSHVFPGVKPAGHAAEVLAALG